MSYSTAIIDLDNCISEDNWRWPLFDLHLPLPNDRYWRYHDACHGDMYKNQDVIATLARQYQIVVFTSRPEIVRHKTTQWLRKWKIPFTNLFMRPNSNHEGSVDLKRKMLTQWLDSSFDVQYAIDDRMDILDMYADEGVRICQHVSIHNPEIVHP